jgi:hypothetical protein
VYVPDASLSNGTASRIAASGRTHRAGVSAAYAPELNPVEYLWRRYFRAGHRLFKVVDRCVVVADFFLTNCKILRVKSENAAL